MEKVIEIDSIKYICQDKKIKMLEPNIYNIFYALSTVTKHLEKIAKEYKKQFGDFEKLDIIIGKRKVSITSEGKIYEANIQKKAIDVSKYQQLITDLKNIINKPQKTPEDFKEMSEISKQIAEEMPKIQEELGKVGRKMTEEAQEFISKKIKTLMDEGYPQEQAIAIAYSMARERGFDVPEAPKKEAAKMTEEAQEFISKKIKTLMEEGYPQEQAIAIAYRMARERGFDVPEKPKKEAAKMTEEAREFISKKIKTLMDEGYPQEQAIAIAYNMAREKGYDVPEAPKKKAAETVNVSVRKEDLKDETKGPSVDLYITKEYGCPDDKQEKVTETKNIDDLAIELIDKIKKYIVPLLSTKSSQEKIESKDKVDAKIDYEQQERLFKGLPGKGKQPLIEKVSEFKVGDKVYYKTPEGLSDEPGIIVGIEGDNILVDIGEDSPCLFDPSELVLEKNIDKELEKVSNINLFENPKYEVIKPKYGQFLGNTKIEIPDFVNDIIDIVKNAEKEVDDLF